MLKKALCQVRYWFFSKWLWIVGESIQLAQKAYVNLLPINWKRKRVWWFVTFSFADVMYLFTLVFFIRNICGVLYVYSSAMIVWLSQSVSFDLWWTFWLASQLRQKCPSIGILPLTNCVFSDTFLCYCTLCTYESNNIVFASFIFVSRKLSKWQNKHFKLEIYANTYAYLERVTTLFLRN